MSLREEKKEYEKRVRNMKIYKENLRYKKNRFKLIVGSIVATGVITVVGGFAISNALNNAETTKTYNFDLNDYKVMNITKWDNMDKEEVFDTYYDEDIYGAYFKNKKDYMDNIIMHNYSLTIPIVVSINDPLYRQLLENQKLVEELPKWIEHTTENGDSFDYFINSGMVHGKRTYTQASNELLEINKENDHKGYFPKYGLQIDEEVTIFNPDRVNAERQIYKIEQLLLDTHKLNKNNSKTK